MRPAAPRSQMCKNRERRGACRPVPRENAGVSTRAAVQIVGAGPAGSAAAITALGESAAVHISDRAHTTRHKVCGEFLAAEACRVLDELGVWSEFLRRTPARVHRCRLHFGSRMKEWRLAETAFGLSRLALDTLLLDRAASLGATVSRGVPHSARTGDRVVLASGRNARTAARPRLFGFKAHFAGPADDAVELFFTETGYVGISPVEGSLTNVCGLAPETALRACGFELDDFLRRSQPLADRLRPLSRQMNWLTTGPLIFSGPAADASEYRAGDALGFVDPFTGSGILHALLTGRMAGAAAARGMPVTEYLHACRRLLARPAAVSAAFRVALRSGLAAHVARLVPGPWMYRLTRAGYRA